MNHSMYSQAINNVINYINSGLEQDLSLEKLGQVASFSPFHFQRIFKAYVGESPHDFIIRLRLEKVVALLGYQKELSITEIALKTGFSSPTSFARAFKEHYGISASTFRKTDKNFKDLINRKNCKVFDSKMNYPYLRTGDVNNRQSNGNDFEVVIKQLPSFQVAFIRLLRGLDKGSYNTEFTKAFNKVTTWAIDKKVITEPHYAIGIVFDYPDITDVSKCRYDAGITILDTVHVGEDEIGIQNISQGTYASIQIKVNNQEKDSFQYSIKLLGEAVDYLYREWLPQSHYILSDKPSLDIYHTLPTSNPIMIEHCLPVSLYKE